MKLTSLNKRDSFYAKGTASISSFTSKNSQKSKRQDIISNLKKEIELGTKSSIEILKQDLSEQNLFHLCLKHVTTTKKTLCHILDIPIEAACRYKRKLEKSGKLAQSSYKVICPLTSHKAHLITTNPNEFDKIKEEHVGQLKLF